MTLVHVRAFALMLFGLVLILGFTRWGDPPRLLIDATPAAVLECAPPKPNPCATIRCEPRVDTRVLT